MALVVILLVAGAILILLETILPGLIAGIAGLGCVVAGVIVAYAQFGVETGNWILLGVLVASVGGFFLWTKYFPDSRAARIIVSDQVSGDIRTERPELLHQTGAALTLLRPSGTAVINGQRVDVVTEGSLIERGTPVKVVAVEGLRVVVRALADEQSKSQTNRT